MLRSLLSSFVVDVWDAERSAVSRTAYPRAMLRKTGFEKQITIIKAITSHIILRSVMIFVLFITYNKC